MDLADYTPSWRSGRDHDLGWSPDMSRARVPMWSKILTGSDYYIGTEVTYASFSWEPFGYASLLDLSQYTYLALFLCLGVPSGLIGGRLAY